MSGPHDYQDVKGTRAKLDDESIEALLGGEQVSADLTSLASAVDAIRASGRLPVTPSPDLATRMARGDFSDIPVARNSTMGRMMRRLARMSVGTKVASVVTIGVTGMTGVAAAGVLPDAAQARVERVIETVTPIDLPDASDFGQDVADDARDGGVDGQEVADDAKDNGNGPDVDPPKKTPPTEPPVPKERPTQPPRSTNAPTESPADPPGRDAADDRPTPQPSPPKPPVDHNGGRSGSSR